MKKVLSYVAPLALVASSFFMPAGLKASPDIEEMDRASVGSTIFEDNLFNINSSNWINFEPLQFAVDSATQDLNLRRLEAKAILVNFWGKWCPSCRADTPNLEKMWQNYKGSGLVLISLSDNREAISFDAVTDFAREKNLTYPIGMDDSGNPTFTKYRVFSVPYQVLVDGDGRIIARGHPDQVRTVVDRVMGN